jgi:hypothetical protein
VTSLAGEEAIGSVAGVCFVGGAKGHDECMRVGISTADSSVIRCGIYFRPVAFAAVKSSNVCTVRLVFKHTVSCLVCAVIHRVRHKCLLLVVFDNTLGFSNKFNNFMETKLSICIIYTGAFQI